jgi:hypothetical protein
LGSPLETIYVGVKGATVFDTARSDAVFVAQPDTVASLIVQAASESIAQAR